MPKAKMDLATERNPNQGGTYQRRLDDAFKALSVVKTETLQPEIAFAFYIFACEKVAKVMIGMKHGKPGPSPKFRNNHPRASEVIAACRHLKCADIVSDEDVNAIFAKAGDKFSAYSIRERLFHDFGPLACTRFR